MFYKYEIRNKNGEEILYLYLSSKYEFSSEFDYNNEDNIKVLSKNYILTNNIPFKGSTVYLVVDDIITKKINIERNNNISDSYYLPDNFLINLKLNDTSLCEITLREYLLSVLFSMYSNELGDETLKAICILYNTYCFKMMSEDKFILSDNIFFNYRPYTNYRDSFRSFKSIEDRLNKIIDYCAGLYICYNGMFILPFIHYSNSGKTLTNNKYSYLTSVKSLWDILSPNYVNSFEYSFEKLKKILSIDINSNTKITFKNNGSNISFGDNIFSINELKNKLSLSSNDIFIIINSDSICFISLGVGNGYGLSIYGSSCIERNGGKYNNILGYYFPKCRLFQYIKRLSK